jgi:hypothetical protein
MTTLVGVGVGIGVFVGVGAGEPEKLKTNWAEFAADSRLGKLSADVLVVVIPKL